MKCFLIPGISLFSGIHFCWIHLCDPFLRTILIYVRKLLSGDFILCPAIIGMFRNYNRLNHKFMKYCFLYLVHLLLFTSKMASGQGVAFPEDAGVIDITKPPYEADNTGTEIVSDIIQQAINDNTPGGWKIIYFPKGTYLVDTTIEWSRNSWSQGPVFQGYHRDSTIIRLTDNNPYFQLEIVERPVLWTGEGVAQKFDRGIRDMTIHTGTGNPGAAGIKFYSNNEGMISDVSIISGDGNGSIGIHIAYSGENGPLLIRNVYVEGFNYGIKVKALNSVILSRITLKGQKQFGLYNDSHVCSVEELHSINNVIAVYNGSGSSTIVIINSVLEGGSAELAAMKNRGIMFARNITTAGYQQALSNDGGLGMSPAGNNIDEFSSYGVTHLFPSTRRSLNLEIKHPPTIPWEVDTAQWVSIQDYGAIPDDGKDDSKAIQDAIDAGKTTVYIPNNGIYNINDTIYLRGAVQRFTGTNAWFEGNGSIILVDGDTPAVMVERIRRRNPNQYAGVENHSSRILVMESTIFHWIKGKGTGDIYLSDCLGKIHLTNTETRVRARHHNTENPGETDWNIKNEGADLWILGLKTESFGLKSWVCAGGKTEILGAHIYPQCTEKLTPMFRIDDASFSGACIRETNFCNKEWPAYYTRYIVERQRMISDTLYHDDAPSKGNGSGRAYSLYVSYIDGIDYPSEPYGMTATPGGHDRINLSWNSDGLQTDGYIIERRIEKTFVPLDTIFGTEYFYNDTGLLPTWTYGYRVVAFNQDGYSLYSNEDEATTSAVSTRIPKKDDAGLFRIFPNPVNGKLFIEPSIPLQNLLTGIEIYNQSGMLVLRKQILLTDSVSLDLPNLPEGIYVVRLMSQAGSVIQPLVIN